MDLGAAAEPQRRVVGMSSAHKNEDLLGGTANRLYRKIPDLLYYAAEVVQPPMHRGLKS